ncbi:MAG: hypothetical protein SRB2_01493 [Desulfobacteraceae bacterium Eth-SRB2]|nr:MAG: hypothetical protein SRB2_01493 [Desulfobacteraceae bacterium Eth-SRB2]
MKLHFDPNQQYQVNAVKSIVGIFDGQPLSQGNFGFSISENGQLFNENGVGNRIDRTFICSTLLHGKTIG